MKNKKYTVRYQYVMEGICEVEAGGKHLVYQKMFDEGEYGDNEIVKDGSFKITKIRVSE